MLSSIKQGAKYTTEVPEIKLKLQSMHAFVPFSKNVSF